MRLTFWTFSFLLIICNNCQEIFIQETNRYVCVTNSSHALTWISKSTNLSESSFLPETSTNNFDSKIAPDNKTKRFFTPEPWFLVKDYNDFSIIDDRRWEDFQVFHTFPEPKNSTPKYLKVASFNSTDFDLVFSVRARFDVNFFLCDKKNMNSSCYWFTLEEFEGKSSTVKSCINTSTSRLQCPVLEQNAKDPTQKPIQKILSNNSWSHFVVSKKKKVISVKVMDGLDWSTVVSTENENFQVKSMFVGKRSVEAFWKIHTVTFIRTTEKTSVTLGPPISVKSGQIPGKSVCVSMMASMCSHCFLQLNLKSNNFEKKEIFAAPKTRKSNRRWFEIKFVVDNIPQNIDTVKLLVTTKTSNSESKDSPFWDLDEIRLCQRKEIRVITSSEKASCQLISENTTFVPFGSPERWVKVEPIRNIHIKWTVEENLIKMTVEWKQFVAKESKLEEFHIIVLMENDTTPDNNIGVVFRDAIKLNNYDEDSHQYAINATFLPSTLYTVRITADNKYSTESATESDLSPPLLINKQCFGAEDTITLKLSPNDNKFYDVIVLISGNSDKLYDHVELKPYETDFGTNLSKFRQVDALYHINGDYPIIIGRNSPLIPNCTYNITLILTSIYRKRISKAIDVLSCTTANQTFKKIYLWFLLLLIVLAVIPIVYLLHKKKKKSRCETVVSRAVLQGVGTLKTQNTNSDKVPFPNVRNKLENRINKDRVTYLQIVLPSMIIPNKLFPKYVKDSERNGDLDRQFELINANIKTISSKVENFVYHIDMVYVDGSVIPKAYLLTEVPNKDTVKNFWRCVYNENVQRIVLLGEENEDCFGYCPRQNKKITFSDLSIKTICEQSDGLNFNCKILILKKGQEKRQIDQICFTYSGSNIKLYVPFFKKLLANDLAENSPILIHSSGNMKKIGFVLLCDMSLRMVKEEGVSDVLKNFKRLMDQVGHLVNSPELYKLCFSVISEFIFEDNLYNNMVKMYNNLKKGDK